MHEPTLKAKNKNKKAKINWYNHEKIKELCFYENTAK